MLLRVSLARLFAVCLAGYSWGIYMFLRVCACVRASELATYLSFDVWARGANNGTKKKKARRFIFRGDLEHEFLDRVSRRPGACFLGRVSRKPSSLARGETRVGAWAFP